MDGPGTLLAETFSNGAREVSILTGMQNLVTKVLSCFRAEMGREVYTYGLLGMEEITTTRVPLMDM